MLEEVSLFDVYRGAQVAEGKKSVAYSLTMRADDRTLTDEEADAAMQAGAQIARKPRRRNPQLNPSIKKAPVLPGLFQRYICAGKVIQYEKYTVYALP